MEEDFDVGELPDGFDLEEVLRDIGEPRDASQLTPLQLREEVRAAACSVPRAACGALTQRCAAGASQHSSPWVLGG